VVIVQRLTDWVWVGLDSVLNESRIMHVAQMFCALRNSLDRLSRYYKDLPPTSNPSDGTRFFPSVTAYRDGCKTVEFEYQGYLENEPSCTAIRARTCTEPIRDIVVKFVDRYSERAHKILWEAGLAPRLDYCGSLQLDDGQPSYGPLSMVVMEYIHGQPLNDAKGNMDTVTKQRVRNDVRRALDLLHARSMVFGDLRPPNVMVTTANKVNLIDFDWAGEYGQVKYPCLISPSVSWPAGVEALGLIEYAHDNEMLKQLL
jgi:serine/threonine protein kinase